MDDDAAWREKVLVFTTDALGYFTVDARRLWGTLRDLAEERPDAHEIVFMRDWLASAGAIFVDNVAKIQDSVKKPV